MFDIKEKPKLFIELKSFTLTNTESQYLEWKLNEYIEILLQSPSAKPFFAKNNDGFYTLFPNFGVSISKDTKDDWEINLLKFLSANVPNKHFDFGYTQSHKKEENTWYEKIYDILIGNNFEDSDGKIDIGKVTVTTDNEINITAQVLLRRTGLEWYIEGLDKKGEEYIKYESGISYHGEAKGEEGNRLPHGKGVMTVPDGPVITGDFKDGLADGYAKMDFLDGEVYEGEFKKNKKHGKGIYVWPDGRKYEGEYQKGEEHGKGIYKWPSGNSWQGEWENGKKDGVGTYNYSDGAKFTSDWHEGEWVKMTMVDFDENNNEIEEIKNSKYTSSKGFVFYGKYNDDKQRTVDGTITSPDGLEINLKDCEKYKDKDLTDAFTELKNTYQSHKFEYNDTNNGILSFERASEIFGDCTNYEELSYGMDEVYGLKINSIEGFVILHANKDELHKALEEARDIESEVIIKSDNIEFIELLVEMLKLNNRDNDTDNINKDIKELDKPVLDNIKPVLKNMVKEIKELNKEVVDKENEIMEENKETTIKWEKPDFDRDLCTEYLADWVERLFAGEVQVLEISKNDLVKGIYDNLKEKGKYDWKDKKAGANIIGEKEILAEEEEDKIYMDEINGGDAEELFKKHGEYNCIQKKVLLYCEGEWIWSVRDYEEIETFREEPIEEVKEEASAEVEVGAKENVDSIQSFRNFMKEKFPSLKLPKNKPYAGIDLKDGYSINFHVQKKAVVLSFRSVKTDPEEIMRILSDKGLNGKDIGDGHVLKAAPGKRNPSIITMNIEIPYSSEEELASDELRENVRSYFEKFSVIFNFGKGVSAKSKPESSTDTELEPGALKYKIKHKYGTGIIEDVGGGVSIDDLIDIFLDAHDSWSEAISSNFYDYDSDWHEHGPTSVIDTIVLENGTEKKISVSVIEESESKELTERESLGWEVFFTRAISHESGEWEFESFELESEFNEKYLVANRNSDSESIFSSYTYHNTETDEYVDIEGEFVASNNSGIDISLFVNTKNGVEEIYDEFYHWREEMKEKGIDTNLKEEVKKYLVEKYNIDLESYE